jgi:hypothetical protein
MMETYDDLAELARICLKHAGETKSRAVARELRRMAKEYQLRAAELVGSNRVHLSEHLSPPPRSTEEARAAVQQQQQVQPKQDNNKD